MLRSRLAILALGAALGSGCVALAPPGPILPGTPPEGAEASAHSFRVYPMDGFEEDPSRVPGVSDELMQIEISKTLSEAPLGSRVSIALAPRGQRRFRGILVKKSAAEIELMNCVWSDPVLHPGGHLQSRTSHVPSRLFQVSDMVGVDLLDPPAPGFAVPNLDEDSSDVSIAKIVYRSGQKTTLYPLTVPKGSTLDPEHPPDPGSVRFYGDPEP